MTPPAPSRDTSAGRAYNDLRNPARKQKRDPAEYITLYALEGSSRGSQNRRPQLTSCSRTACSWQHLPNADPQETLTSPHEDSPTTYPRSNQSHRTIGDSAGRATCRCKTSAIRAGPHQLRQPFRLSSAEPSNSWGTPTTWCSQRRLAPR